MLERPHSSSHGTTNRQAEQRRLRDRRHRERVRACKVCVSVEVGEELLGLILRLGWLHERDAANRVAIGRALTAMLIASAQLEQLADAAR
jgi:hypothetical protein